MELEQEWELLSDDDDGGGDDGNKIYSSSRRMPMVVYSPTICTTTVLHMDYFICPPPKASPEGEQVGEFTPNCHLILPPLPPPPHSSRAHHDPLNMKCFNQVLLASDHQNLDPASQVSFKKIRETDQFVDIKVDSSYSSVPKSTNITAPPCSRIEGANFQSSEEKTGINPCELDSDMGMVIVRGNMESNSGSGGLNIWKWGLNGIGAVCSFGVAAAATLCIIIFSSNCSLGKHHPHHLKICSNEQRIKLVVHQNEAIAAAAGGVPITTAHITFGGYYDAPL